MDKNKAIEILKDFNDYRRGNGEHKKSPSMPKFKASEIGEAIGMAIDALIKSDGKVAVLDAVVSESGISLDTIRSDSREREVVIAREVAASILRKQGYTLKEIGEMINRTHSNVYHLVEEVSYWEMDSDLFVRELSLLYKVKKRIEKRET